MIHQAWLCDIYPFAGNYRTVNMSKGDFLFAAAHRIESLMKKFESDILKKYTPCHFKNTHELAYALGIVHAEFIIIHPFREGNGRIARLLADLMATQADNSPLNYKSIEQINNSEGFKRYLDAIHAAVSHDYQPIQKIFIALLEQSQQI